MKDFFNLARTVGFIFFIMYSFLGNDDTWEELMLQEGRLEELGLNATENGTDATEMIKEAAECVGEACKAVFNEAVGETLHDEF